MQSTHKDWRGKGQFALVGTQRGTYTFVYLSNMQQWMEKKRYCWFNFQVSSFSFFLCCFSCLFLFLPPDYFYICYSCLFPSSPSLLSISLSYHTCSLFQSWPASKLVCSVFLCHLKDSSHTRHTYTWKYTHKYSVHSCTYALTRIYTHNISLTCAYTHI